jgi:GntR family transcriptional regulator
MNQFDPTRPIYLQIQEEIKKRAVRGQYAPGTKLPSVREMASEMQVNPNTMARAFQNLEQEGFIESRRGLGSFVPESDGLFANERKRLAQEAHDRFLDEIQQLKPDKELLDWLRNKQEEAWS